MLKLYSEIISQLRPVPTEGDFTFHSTAYHIIIFSPCCLAYKSVKFSRQKYKTSKIPVIRPSLNRRNQQLKQAREWLFKVHINWRETHQFGCNMKITRYVINARFGGCAHCISDIVTITVD